MKTQSKFYFLFLLIFLCSCKDRRGDLENGNYMIGYGRQVNGRYLCAYIYNKNHFLIRNYCRQDSMPHGTIVDYYESGVPKTIQTFDNGIRVGNKISYFSSGVIDDVIPYTDGKVNGMVKKYFPTGIIKAVNLYDNDSLYYVRVYSDSLNSDQFGEDFFPIVMLNKETAKINDSIRVTIRFPINTKYGFNPGEYNVHYDTRPPEYFRNDSIPIPGYTRPLLGTDIYFDIFSNIESHEKFYCFLTDSTGHKVSELIFKDLIFTK